MSNKDFLDGVLEKPKCTHKKWVEGRWEEWYDDWSDESHREWHEGYHEDTVEDIDTHRMRCTQCGEISYYSGAAREYYEEGKTEHRGILGLDREEIK